MYAGDSLTICLLTWLKVWKLQFYWPLANFSSSFLLVTQVGFHVWSFRVCVCEDKSSVQMKWKLIWYVTLFIFPRIGMLYIYFEVLGCGLGRRCTRWRGISDVGKVVSRCWCVLSFYARVSLFKLLSVKFGYCLDRVGSLIMEFNV